MADRSPITIHRGNQSITFSPKSCKPTYESLAGEDSGRAISGAMNINWILNNVTKLEIELPPYSFDDATYNNIINFVQGRKDLTVDFYDVKKHQKVTGLAVYCSNSSADWYSGVILNGIVQGASFALIEMNGEKYTD